MHFLPTTESEQLPKKNPFRALGFWRRLFQTKALILILLGLKVFSQMLETSGSLAIGVIVLFTAIAWSQLRQVRLLGKFRRFAPLAMVVLTSILVSIWFGVSAEPASAQFFGNAEEFFSGTLNVGDDEVVAIVFNTLRALYLLYIAVAFIGVVNAVRQDEDWQTVARTPLLVVVVVTVADVITGFVTGDGAGA